MDRPWLAVIGIALVVLVLIDVAWTILAVAGGRGPVTNLVARGLWGTVRGTPNHRVLQLAGYAILVTLLLTWVLAMWAGWALVFNAGDGGVVKASSQQPAGVLAKIAYAAGALAGAGAGYTASSGGWELANNLAALAGLALFTGAISYLVQLVQAASQKRATALHIAGLGATPAEIVAHGAGQSGLGPVVNQITSLTTSLALVARQHLALPVLHYLHLPERRAAIELSVARLDEALSIVEHGLEADHRPVVRPARMAISEYLRTMTVSADAEPPPAPDVSLLHRQGVAVADDFAERLDRERDRRRQLASLVAHNGWDWDADVAGSPAA